MILPQFAHDPYFVLNLGSIPVAMSGVLFLELEGGMEG